MLKVNSDELGQLDQALRKANDSGSANELFRAHVLLEDQNPIMRSGDVHENPTYVFRIEKDGLELSIPEASLSYLKEAALKKHPEANELLGDIYAYGNSYDETMEEYTTKECEPNGVHGLHITPDFDEALKYYLAAAKLKRDVKEGLSTVYKHFASNAVESLTPDEQGNSLGLGPQPPIDVKTSAEAHQKAHLAMSALIKLENS